MGAIGRVSLEEEMRTQEKVASPRPGERPQEIRPADPQSQLQPPGPGGNRFLCLTPSLGLFIMAALGVRLSFSTAFNMKVQL